MSVDDRLRRGLEANARSFHPQGEARLDRVRRRWRRRRVVVAVGVASVAASVAGGTWMVVGGGGDGRDGRGVEPAAPTVATADPSPRASIPDSNWRRVVTRSEAVALGLDRDFLRDNFGDADRLPLVLSFVGGLYSQSGRYPGGWSVGDAGAVAYDDAGRLVLTSTSSGCPGCTVTVDWRIVGDDLRLEDVDDEQVDELAADDRLMVTGSWSRQDR